MGIIYCRDSDVTMEVGAAETLVTSECSLCVVLLDFKAFAFYGSPNFRASAKF